VKYKKYRESLSLSRDGFYAVISNKKRPKGHFFIKDTHFWVFKTKKCVITFYFLNKNMKLNNIDKNLST